MVAVLAGCIIPSFVCDLSTGTEGEAAIEKLTPSEQRALADWLNSRLMEDTPEMLAALDVGIRSLETEPGVSLETAREFLPGGGANEPAFRVNCAIQGAL